VRDDRFVKVLVLGGTLFAGRAIAAAGVARGWVVTTFNRGLSGTDVDGVQVVHGDRDRQSDVEALAGMGPWDAVIDTSAYVPKETLRVAETLEPVSGRYVLLSTVSVYAGWPRVPLSEDSAVLAAPPDAGRDFGPEDVEDGPTRYGYLKTGCELAVAQVLGDIRTTILRPGVVLGPGEYVGRLPWWLDRVAAGGEILAPAPAARSIQPIDVRDLAAFALHAIVTDLSGTFNVTAPIGRETFGGLLDACAAATGASPDITWVSDEQLLKLGLRQWSELPLWRVYDGVWRVDSTRAQEAGLVARRLAETVRDTWNWMQDVGSRERHERASEIGLSSERERKLIAAIRSSAVNPRSA
jgi:2'-hydroxyisoflavone reductase